MVPLVEHWDGSSWTQVKVAPPGAQLVELTAVVAPSATDVWAFGYTRYAQHWDGTAWKRVALPVPKGSQSGEFHAAAAVSPNDIWAVGDAELAGSRYGHAIADHWNGHRWRMVPTPPSAGYAQLVAVTALSAKDVWGVGVRGVDTGRRITERTLTMHWNGKAWKRVPSPSPATSSRPPDRSTTPSPPSPAARRTTCGQSASTTLAAANGDHAMHPLALHWNGTRWKAVASPDPAGPTHRSFFYGVAAPSSTGVWAVGSAARNGVQHALTERWDGTRWQIVPATGNPLAGVSASTADDVWAAGGETGGSVTHWNGSAWTIQTKLDHDDALGAVAEVSPTDVWAVGVRFVY